MSQEHQIIVSNELSEVYRGFSQMTTTMECLAESKSVAVGGCGVGSDVLDTLSIVTRSLLSKLEDVMLIIDQEQGETE